MTAQQIVNAYINFEITVAGKLGAGERQMLRNERQALQVVMKSPRYNANSVKAQMAEAIRVGEMWDVF